jgi:hypothetical protein
MMGLKLHQARFSLCKTMFSGTQELLFNLHGSTRLNAQ